MFKEGVTAGVEVIHLTRKTLECIWEALTLTELFNCVTSKSCMDHFLSWLQFSALPSWRTLISTDSFRYVTGQLVLCGDLRLCSDVIRGRSAAGKYASVKLP